MLAVCASLALPLAWSLPLPAEARHRPSCSSSGSTTVYANSHGRFFTKRARSVVPGRRGYTAFHSCSSRYGKRFRLAESGFEGEDRYSRFRIRGPFAAYAYHPSCGACEHNEADVLVQDLRTGRHRTFVGSTGEDPLDGDSEDVTDLELKGNGAVGWIAERVRDGATTVQVRVRDRGGSRLLDEGNGIARTSLRLDGTRLMWRHDGAQRSATLR